MLDETADTNEYNYSKIKMKGFPNYKEKAISNAKMNELRALELYIARSNATNTRSSTLNGGAAITGNEELAHIYGYVLQVNIFRI